MKASLKNAEVAANNSVFSEEIVKQYKDLKFAIEKYKSELQELYGIRVEADGLAAAINAHKVKVAEMDTEYKKKKELLDSEYEEKATETDEKIEELNKTVKKAKAAADEEIAEYNAQLHKKRIREKDEYEYNEKISRKVDADAWAEEKAKREAEIQSRVDAAKEREIAISEKEAEIEEMVKQIEGFPAKLEEAKEEAAKEAKAKADKGFAFERRALETDKKHIEEMYAAKIENLETQVSTLTQSNIELSRKLDAAYDKMKEMATATVQAGATVKVVSSNEK